MGERLPCTQEVIGSNPFTSTTEVNVNLFLTEPIQPLIALKVSQKKGGKLRAANGCEKQIFDN